MRSRRLTWILLSLLCLAGVWLLWQQGGRSQAHTKSTVPAVATIHSASNAPQILSGHSLSTNTTPGGTISAATNKFAYRLANTTKSIDQLLRDDKAILLENALIDTRNPLNLSIPANLRSQADPGAYIVQARGAIDNAFRAMLKASGATIVSYIPNNAYLVNVPSGVANAIASQGFQVIPYEPYYKVQSSLLRQAVGQMDLPDGAMLNLELFADNAPATIQQIEKLGGQVFAQDRSPFGPIVRVIPPKDWTVLATLSGVQRVEPCHQRVHANDLSRAAVGVSTDTLTSTNYMNLYGSNVIVEVNDSGIDATHPDFQTGGGLPVRVVGDPANLVDIDGHGTHVAGIIAGNGLESTTVTNASGSIIATMPGPTATNGQFRGKAPLAKLLAMDMFDSDRVLQETAALTNALISDNSWNYVGNTYDLAAASYDAAVRDALPTVTGSQPVLFVFSAGNNGNGDDSSNPGGGVADSIQSPATAKNVVTVGAIQEFRNITNEVTNADNSVSATWRPETSTSSRIAGFSSRGNVGVGIEGAYGRRKPDVVAPGTFVISTRSSQWDITDYFYQTPTNHDIETTHGIVAPPGLWANGFPIVPDNAVQVAIYVTANAVSPDPFPNLPIYFNLVGSSAYTLFTINNEVLIPPDGGLTIADILNSETYYGFDYAVSNNTANTISFDLTTDIITTNNPGNYFLVLSNLNQFIGTLNPASTGPGPYYRYETGTSMSAADVSGVLALMQDFFTNQWHTLPSPALLKAMLINGSRATGFYNFQAQSSINYEGWGLINLPAALQPGITNQFGQSCSSFVLEQNPTNALATGDSQTFHVVTATNTQPLRITLAWTDPPGDPVAAIKLVNDLNLVVTNLSDPVNPIVYYGNDIASSTFNSARNTNTPPNFDSINNVENVYLPQLTGTNFSVTVMGYRVNVNAVTAQTNNFTGTYAPNVVQDYALVISSGDGQITNAMVVTATPMVSNPTTNQQITYVSGNSGPLINQFVGANTPLMGTNALLIPLTNSLTTVFTTNELNGVTNEQITIGMTNQWHFYVVTNTFASTNSAFTNVAFVTFLPPTLSIPRMGVYEDLMANATRPEADIDLYVSTDPGLTNLDPTVIFRAATNGLASVSGPSPNTFATAGGIYEMASLGRGGTEYVVDTNSQSGEVYYIGVKSEDQMASEYAFLPVFTATPFSQMRSGNQIVNGFVVPANITDGTPAVPGYVDVVGIAIYPIQVRRVVVTNQVWHQNFGDLIGTLSLNGGHPDVLNNHDLLGGSPGPYTLIYDDSRQGDIAGSQPSDGPGNLNGFMGLQGSGVWRLREVDDSLTQTGVVENVTLIIEPHKAKNGVTFFTDVQANSWFYDYIDVPPGATNLTITVTNLTGSPGYPGTLQTVDLYVKYGDIPTLTSSDTTNVVIDTGTPPTNSISIGPPLTSGRYFFGVYNPSAAVQTVSITATYYLSAAPGQVDYTSAGLVPILDDAVTMDSIFVPNDAIISSVDVGLSVEHPRISDLVFHLISPGPDGTRILLVENRGGTDTNGMGTTNSYLVLTEDTNLTTVPIKFAPPPFTATNDLFYLPEQPMDSLAGKNAFGTWTLEIQDDRAGANLTNWLTSWQLRFIFTTTNTTILNTNSTFANFIPSGGIAYYLIKVPTSASSATNILRFATGQLNVWFNPTNPPVGINPPDSLLITNALSGTNELLSVGSAPLLPSEFYWLGVQNTNSFTVNYRLDVIFDDATSPRPLSAFFISGAVMTGNGARLQWNAPSDVQFQVEWTTNISPPIVWTINATHITSSNGTFTFTDSGSTNSRARFYRLLQVQ
jgi:subtilisin family serine protease/subtilisin-like proprotein convertase family protein